MIYDSKLKDVKDPKEFKIKMLELQFGLSQRIGKPWIHYNTKYISHFIATLYYNGVSLYYIDAPTDFETFKEKIA